MAFYVVLSIILSLLTGLESSMVPGMRFGITSYETPYAIFQKPFSTMEAYCTAPPGRNSTTIYFLLSSGGPYMATTTPEYVSAVDNVTAKLTWRFDYEDHTASIYCDTPYAVDEEQDVQKWREGNGRKIFVNPGANLSSNPLNCSFKVRWSSADDGVGEVECILRRSSHTRAFTGVEYLLYLVNGTGNEVEDKLLWRYIDDTPTRKEPCSLPLQFSIESRTIFRMDELKIKIVLHEKYAIRNVTVIQSINPLHSLVLPPDTLVWEPFTNSTGFIVKIHPGLLHPTCGGRTYAVEFKLSSSEEDYNFTAHSFAFHCDLCDDGKSECGEIIRGLAPGRRYTVLLRQRISDEVPVARLRLAELLQPPTLQPAQETQVLTEEQAPQVGPEIHRVYQVMDCDPASTACHLSNSCASALENGACQAVRIFWKDIPRSLSNGVIRFYELRIVRKWHSLAEETINLTAPARMADIYRHPSQQLSIAIAGGTSKGLPPTAVWSTTVIEAESGTTLPHGIMLSRSSTVDGSCNISWFIEADVAAGSATAQNATLLHCPSMSPNCQDYATFSIRAQLTANDGWLPMERYLWNSVQLGDSDDFLCREGTLALAITPSAAAPTSSMARLEAVDCRVTMGSTVSPSEAKITPSYSDSDGLCIKWLSRFPETCDTAPGLVVLLNVSLLSSDRGRLLEQRVLNGKASGHCFGRDSIEEAETYIAILTWTADIGLPEPYFIGPVEVPLTVPGLTAAAKGGVALAALACTALIVIGLIGCVRKVRVYRKTWRANLTIPKIKNAAATNAGPDCALLSSSPLLQSKNAEQKCIYYEDSRTTAEQQQSGRLRKWSSKDSAFASQDSNSPPADNDQSINGRRYYSSSHIDEPMKETESNADVAGEVYTTFGGLLYGDQSTDPPGSLANCLKSTKAKQSQRFFPDAKGSVAYCPSNDASRLLLICVPGCEDGCGEVGVSDGIKEDRKPDSECSYGGPSQFCGSPLDLLSLPRSHGALNAPHRRYAEQGLRDSLDNSSVSSYAFAAADTPDSVSSDYMLASDLQASASDVGPHFRCPECEGGAAPKTMDYITVSDAIKMASA